ncbi:hypothetical protein DSO57_1023281 [Entomophthora muscae]|uniref:Uncharacterized protein n=1 Tax=Entomophthora muscae TaxID=34485 RepID=A0ACC2TPT2_9FUNG|nr:hypothetical protein DSO57_1023281 [Entomophthora muscae]
MIETDETELLIPNNHIENVEIERAKSSRAHLFALTAALLFSIGSHYATNNFGALKEMIEDDLDISNASYEITQSTIHLMNTVLPLFGGIMMDQFGSTPGALISNSFILLGNLFIALTFSLQKSSYSFDLLLLGRGFHGIGSGMIVVSQEMILSRWFSNSDMATVIGLQIGVSRFANWVAQASANFIAELTGSIEGPMWVTVCICFLSWLSTLIYAKIIKPFEELSAKNLERTSISAGWLFYLPLGFWILPFTAMSLDSIWAPFFASAVEYIEYSDLSVTTSISQKDVKAGWESSFGFLLPIFLSPMIGWVIDKKGHRSIIVVCSALLTVISLTILSFNISFLFLGLVLFSVAHTLGPVALTSSIPLILPKELVGTGIGANKVGISLGITLLHLLAGLIQTKAPGTDWSNVILLLLLVSLFGVFMAGLYCIYSSKYMFGILDVPSKLRRDVVWENFDSLISGRPLSSLSPPLIYQKLMACAFILLVAVSWIVYFLVFILNGKAPNHFP